MNAITLKTRKQSYNEIKQSLSKRESEVLSALGNNEMTANEIAFKLFQEGKTPFFNRNYVQPRANELVNWGVIEVIGKRKCNITGKTCCVYRKVMHRTVENYVDNSTKCIQQSFL